VSHTDLLLAALFFAVAILYSSVGHAGASGYIASMALPGFAPEQVRPTGLALNLVVGGIGLYPGWRGRRVRPRSGARRPRHWLRGPGNGRGCSGDTHRQEISSASAADVTPERISTTKIHLPEGVVCAVMVGSVGQPRDGDLRAAWTLWDSDSRVVEFHRAAYPANEAAQAIVAADLPVESALRLLDPAAALTFRRMVGL